MITTLKKSLNELENEILWCRVFISTRNVKQGNMKRIQTRKKLGELYNVDPETISRWLKRIGITHKYALTPKELEFFISEIGTPDQLKESANKLLG